MSARASVLSHEAFNIDSFKDKLFWEDDFFGKQLKDEWDVTVVGAGGIAVVDGEIGGVARFTTGALNGNVCTLDWNDFRGLHVDKRVTMEIRVKISSLVATIQFELYKGGNDRAMFRSTGGNWTIWCENGGAITNPASDIATDTDYHIYRIECFPAGEVHFYYDGDEVNVSPLTTNIPDDDFLQPSLFYQTKEDVSHYMDLDYVGVRQYI